MFAGEYRRPRTAAPPSEARCRGASAFGMMGFDDSMYMILASTLRTSGRCERRHRARCWAQENREGLRCSAIIRQFVDPVGCADQHGTPREGRGRDFGEVRPAGRNRPEPRHVIVELEARTRNRQLIAATCGFGAETGQWAGLWSVRRPVMAEPRACNAQAFWRKRAAGGASSAP